MNFNEKDLIREAFSARQSAYAPYSEFKVGAAILCNDNTVISGANIENASYGAAICAERCAVVKAVSEGKKNFEAIAICGGNEKEIDKLSDYAYPCGICRQVLREFVDPQTFIVIIAKSTDEYKKFTLSQLLPESFGPDNLK